MKKAQNSLIGVYAIADGRHPLVEANMPVIVASHDMVMKALEKLMGDI